MGGKYQILSRPRGSSMSTFVFIMGPTAVGKSELALLAAQTLGGEVVNCDSLQLYKGLDIGTAKPSYEDKETVPHHLFDIVEVGDHFTAGDYRREVLKLFERRKPACFFFVGGSGFYFRALEKGMYQVPQVSKKVHQELVDNPDSSSLYRELEERDLETARRIKIQDRYRIVRALGVIRESGQTLSKIREEFEEKQEKLPVPVTKIGITMDRSLLRKRVICRTLGMLDRGLVEETKDFVHRGYGSWAPLKSVGYKECQMFLKQGGDRGQLLRSIVTSTMQLAKRQMTWFRKDPGIRWYERSEVENWSIPLEWMKL